MGKFSKLHKILMKKRIENVEKGKSYFKSNKSKLFEDIQSLSIKGNLKKIFFLLIN